MTGFEQAVGVDGRILVGLLLGVSGVGKLLNLPAAALGIRSYDIVPARAAAALTLVLALVETIVASILIAGMLPALAAVAAILLLGVFSFGAMAAILRRSTQLCHCFGRVYQERLGWEVPIRNMALAIALFPNIRFGRISLAPSAWLTAADANMTVSDLVAVGSAVSLIVLGYLIVARMAGWEAEPDRFSTDGA